MTEQAGHVGVEDLAAYAAGDLDATAAVAVEAHLVLCDDCRADVEAVNAATGALAALPAVPMPADVAARVDAAVADAAATPVAPPATILPMRRRRPTWAGIGAVAAGAALIGAVAVPLLRGGSGEKAAPIAADSARGSRPVVTKRLASNLDYSHTNLVATLNTALAGTTAPPPAAKGVDAPEAASQMPTSAGPLTYRGNASPPALTALRTDPGRLAACVTALVADLPPVGRVLLFVDFARFSGKDAAVLGFPTVVRGSANDATVDVWVVGPGCGSTPGGDVLDFARIDRPASL